MDEREMVEFVDHLEHGWGREVLFCVHIGPMTPIEAEVANLELARRGCSTRVLVAIDAP